MMRKPLILFTLFLTAAAPLYSQKGSITGTIVNQTSKELLPYVNVAILDETRGLTGGTVSDESGNFFIDNLSEGSYDLLVSFIGFKSDTITGIKITNDAPESDLGRVAMIPAKLAIEEVNVTAMASTSVAKIDRKTYRVEDFETARGGTAVDVLNKLPSISVSPDGDVSVRGTTDFMVYLNGKPTQMEPSVLLAQLSGDMIESIEVITVPTARYDAQGKGGIINITTRTSGAEGLTVSANGLLGGAPWGNKTDRYSDYDLNDYRYGGNLNLLYSKDQLNLYGGVNYYKKNVNGKRRGDARILDTASGAYKHMVASGERPEWYENYSATAGIDYAFSDRSKASASYYYGHRTEGRSAYYVYHNYFADADKQAIPGIPLNEYWIYNPNTDNRYGTFHSLNVSYKHQLGGNGNLLMDALYERSGLSRELNNYDYAYDEQADQVGNLLEQYNQTDNTPLTAYRFALEYQQSIGENHLLELGVQPQFFHIHGSFSYDTLGLPGAAWGDYTELDNTIDLNRNIYAGYLNYSGSFGSLGVITGLRLEYTDQLMNVANPDYFSIFDRPTRSDYEVKQLNWFPTVHLQYEFRQDKVTLAASRRISRPPIKNMSPFLYRRHLEVYVVGDPDLKPEYIENIDLSYDKKLGNHNVTLTGFYRGTDNAIFRVNTVYYKELVLIRSYTNSGNTQALGGELNANLSLGSLGKLFLGGSLYNFRVQGDVFGYREDNRSANWSMKGNLNIFLTKQLKFVTDFNVQSGTVTAQGKNDLFYVTGAALNYSPAALRNWSFILKGIDVLGSNVRGLDTRAYNASGEQIFYQETTYTRYGPILELSVSYSFNTNGKSLGQSKSTFGDQEF